MSKRQSFFVSRLIEQQITSIDLASFTRKLRQVRERLGRTQGSIVGPAIDNEALFLDQMEQVGSTLNPKIFSSC